MNKVLLEMLNGAICCVRCCLRLSGEHRRKLFSIDCSFEEAVMALKSKWNSDEIMPGLQKQQADKHFCALCLGTLHDSSLREFAKEVTKKILDESYDSDTFSMNAIIPNCLSIRQHSMYLHCKQKIREDSWNPENIVTVKDTLKMGLIEEIEENTGKQCDSKSQFRVTIILDYEDDDLETSKLPTIKTDQNLRKRKFDGAQTIGSVQSSLDTLQDVEAMSRCYPCPPNPADKCCTLKEVSCFHESIIVAGRYNKFSRELSQTPWFIDGVKKTETSVQELACGKVCQFFRADDVKFISAGREDVDVKMLGSGRPFAIELINPRRTKALKSDIKNLEMMINESTSLISINRLQVVSKSDMSLLKEGEEHKIKFYRASIYAKKGVTDEQLESLKGIKDLLIKQKTPVRVLHRRPLAVREKVIHTMSAKRIDEENFHLYLSTQAGTYIKEFVHGDFRRTTPSLGSLLGTEVDILELDVEEVQLEWPPSKENEC